MDLTQRQGNLYDLGLKCSRLPQKMCVQGCETRPQPVASNHPISTSNLDLYILGVDIGTLEPVQCSELVEGVDILPLLLPRRKCTNHTSNLSYWVHHGP